MSCFSFSLFSLFSYNIREQEGGTSPTQGRVNTSGRGDVLGKEAGV
jgi:hypothetical protein